MAKISVRLSDKQEGQWVQSISLAGAGIALALVSGVLIYFAKFWVEVEWLQTLQRLVGVVGLIAGLTLVGVALQRGLTARSTPRIAFPCPYCGADNLLLAAPTEDFDCEHCSRTVHFQDGQPVPVRTIVCQFCHTEHRVAASVQRYVCERCNRLLQIGTDPTRKVDVVGTAAMDSNENLLQNYDVLLVAIDKRQENDVAFKIQNLLVTNLPEARRLMQTASQKTPLVVAMDVSQRKAEAVKRQLQELGATATMRPTNVKPSAQRVP